MNIDICQVEDCVEKRKCWEPAFSSFNTFFKSKSCSVTAMDQRDTELNNYSAYCCKMLDVFAKINISLGGVRYKIQIADHNYVSCTLYFFFQNISSNT